MNKYERDKAIQYAHKWWNDYNEAFPKFALNCTNYVSQCLFAGGAPMIVERDKSKGWWCRPNEWSLSWAVSHSLYWYLKSATFGLRGHEVESPTELEPGDIICYDFNGDNRWDHTSIVIGFDNRGNPLVNAHSNNSKNRYWSYTDSAAWSSNCKYAFLKIDVT